MYGDIIEVQEHPLADVVAFHAEIGHPFLGAAFEDVIGQGLGLTDIGRRGHDHGLADGVERGHVQGQDILGLLVQEPAGHADGLVPGGQIRMQCILGHRLSEKSNSFPEAPGIEAGLLDLHQSRKWDWPKTPVFPRPTLDA